MTILIEKIITTDSEEKTEAVAERLAKTLPPGSVIALHGDLGAGKTVFARGFARGLGVSNPVSSPTFTIVQEYRLDNDKWLCHLDLYRIEDSYSALNFGIDEYLEDEDSFVLVEWAERIKPLLPESALRVHIRHNGERCREIEITWHGK
jgi:tRNA threonylcarbamoyladenosine biosynthesis protein TsaE